MKKSILLGLCCLGLWSSVRAQTIDTKNSYVTFEVKNMGKTIEGKMEKMEGTVQLDPTTLATASFEATVAPSTVNTKSKGRDKHLKKDDFFGVTTYNVIKMVSKEIKKTETGYEAVALLTIREVETEVLIPFTVEEKEGRQVLEGTLEVLRKDYGLGSGMGKMMIGLEVQVTIHAEVIF